MALSQQPLIARPLLSSRALETPGNDCRCLFVKTMENVRAPGSPLAPPHTLAPVPPGRRRATAEHTHTQDKGISSRLPMGSQSAGESPLAFSSLPFLPHLRATFDASIARTRSLSLAHYDGITTVPAACLAPGAACEAWVLGSRSLINQHPALLLFERGISRGG